MKYHPDRNPEDRKEKAEAMFVKVGKAYEVLSDPEKRKVYDARGEDGFDEAGNPKKGGFNFGGSGGGFGGGGGGGFNAFNLFNTMFGGGGGGGFGGGGGRKQGGNGGFNFNFGGGGGGNQKPAQETPPPTPQPFDFESKSVTELHAGNAKRLVGKTARGSKVWLVLFYDPSSQKCEKLRPHWSKVADKLKGIVHVGAANCKSKRTRKLCDAYGVTKYPKIVALSASGKDAYDGKISLKGIVAFARSKVSTAHVKTLGSETAMDEWVSACKSDGDIACILLKADVNPLVFRGVSAEFCDKGLKFASFAAPEQERETITTVSMGGTYNIPEEVGLYEGEVTTEGLKDFFKKVASWLKRARKQTKQKSKQEL